MIPQRKGVASRQAHVDLPDGTVEEEHGRQAFTGRASHLYRTAPPTAWVKVEGPLRPWAFDWNQLTPADQTDPEGDPLVVLSNRFQWLDRRPGVAAHLAAQATTPIANERVRLFTFDGAA